MAERPREVLIDMLSALAKSPFRDLPLSERAGWLPVDVREAISRGWIAADGPDTGQFVRPVHITELGRMALASMGTSFGR
jgi:hypothetical protein